MLLDVIIERNVSWTDVNQLMQLDIFIAIALTSAILQFASMYHGWVNLKRDKDRDWRIVWAIFMFGMFGIIVRRVWGFTILIETCAVVGQYYRLLVEAIFQLFLSIVYILFASRFHRMRVKVIPRKELPDA